MNSNTASCSGNELEKLRKQLLKLPPEGERGLEGLLAHALSSFFGRQFRVARAGRQHGRDGATTPGTFDVFFEAKLYSERSPGTEDLQAKLQSALNDCEPYLDVWVLGCTAAVGENTAKELIKTGERFGVTVAVLDWSEHPLPALAVLFASVWNGISEWLRQHAAPELREPIETALDAFKTHPAYAAALSEIAQLLSPATAGWGSARAANCAWLTETLQSRLRAHQAFGQFVAPDDPTFPAITRQHETAKIADAMADKTPSIVAVVGDEGVGKTWLTAMAWESLPKRPIFLLCTTDHAATDSAIRDPLRFLAQLLIEQTANLGAIIGIERWLRRLENWSRREAGEARIWLVLDGLNERESRPWSTVIDKLMELPKGLGLRLLLTSRSAFFEERVVPRLRGYSLQVVRAGQFTDQEVLQGLRSRGADPENVPTAVREFLRNPRIFSIAIGMLDRIRPDELTRERLLFEYWRKRFEEKRVLIHNDGDMRRLLISHARIVREGLRMPGSAVSFRRDVWKQHSGPAQRLSTPTIDDELTEVESGRFFEPDPDQEGNYRVRPEGLPYALGLLVIDEIRDAPGSDMPARIEAAIDPVRGLDLLVDVMLAAFGIACIDSRCSDELAAVLLHSLLGVQNLGNAHAETILAYVAARPGAFIGAAELQWSAPRDHCDRSEWLASFLFERREHDAVRPQLDAAIRRWLGLWCAEPDQPLRYGISEQEIRNEKESSDQRRSKIANRLASLNSAERSFLERNCLKIDAPSLQSIDALAVDLLAGRPLASFADAIVAWQLADSLTGRLYTSSGAEAQLSWVLRLNMIDFEATAKALRESLASMESAEPSEAGLWAAIGTLYSTGMYEDAKRADELSRKVLSRPVIPGWRRVEAFCDSDPLDPQAPDPTNLQRAIDRIDGLDVEKLRASLSMTGEDHDLRELTPALARFAPEPLINKLRAFARDFGRRTGHAARFLAFQLPKISALMTPDEVDDLRSAYLSFATCPETEADREQIVGAQYFLMALLPHLAAEDQLQALLAVPGDGGELILLRRFFKPLKPEVLEAHLEEAEGSNSANALRRTLFFASAGQTALTPKSRSVLRRCFAHPNHVVRLLAFDTAAAPGDQELLTAHAQSDWSSLVAGAESVESFYGSKALAGVPAQFRGVDTLMRMSPDWQSAVIDTWGEECVRRHADIIIKLIVHGLDLPSDLRPDIPIQRDIETPALPTAYSFLSTPPEPPKKNDLSALKRLLDTDDETWKAEELRKQEAVKAYIEKLADHNAKHLVDPIYISGFSAIATQTPDAFERIIDLLRQADDRHLCQLANIAACAAVVLSRQQSNAAVELFKRLGRVKPDVNLVIGPAELPFLRDALWLAEDSSAMKQLRLARLHSVRTDQELFVELLCAANSGKATEVLDHAVHLMTTEHPSHIARALTIAGFCDVNPTSPAILNDSHCATGFLGLVARSARAAYERNAWARHWYGKACAAADRVDFWRSSALMIRASDARFILWFRPSRDIKHESLKPFARFAGDGLKDRIGDKRKDREKTLFGLSAPSDEIIGAILKQSVPVTR